MDLFENIDEKQKEGEERRSKSPFSLRSNRFVASPDLA
jgi:hypothetical protein